MLATVVSINVVGATSKALHWPFDVMFHLCNEMYMYVYSTIICF